jgi:hypothetical protein
MTLAHPRSIRHYTSTSSQHDIRDSSSRTKQKFAPSLEVSFSVDLDQCLPAVTVEGVSVTASPSMCLQYPVLELMRLLGGSLHEHKLMMNSRALMAQLYIKAIPRKARSIIEHGL